MNILLDKIIQNPDLHRCWLATLSYLELCGARKIANYLPKNLHCGENLAKETELLQHAAEEFRHAYFFNKQIDKVKPALRNFTRKLCGREGSRYLQLLDLHIARCLRHVGYRDLKKGCYILTTYAIEKRAQEVYEIYETLLKKHSSPISVRSILIEENGHLRQIEEEIANDPVLLASKDKARNYEKYIFSIFWKEIENEISLTQDDELASLNSVNPYPFRMADSYDNVSSSPSA